MPNPFKTSVAGFVDFRPDNDIPSLEGKVFFVTGGTAGIGKTTIEALLEHHPAHVYFSGRNSGAGKALIADIRKRDPSAGLTFVEMDLASLSSVKNSCRKFVHDRLDVLICNAGIMATPPGQSKEGYEIQFATNHLGHAMLIQQLLPVLTKTADLPGSDVRIVCVTSVGYRMHPLDGIRFSSINTSQQDMWGGTWFRYGQSKLANIVYAAEFARRHPKITTVSVHPGVVETGLVTDLPLLHRMFVYVPTWLFRVPILKAEQGCYNQVCVAASMKKSELVNGGFYMPYGDLRNDMLSDQASSEKLAEELWTWTEKALAEI